MFAIFYDRPGRDMYRRSAAWERLFVSDMTMRISMSSSCMRSPVPATAFRLHPPGSARSIKVLHVAPDGA